LRPWSARSSRTTALHLAEVNAYRNGVVELRYEVQTT
jgi:hypothetical protein